MTKPRKVYLFLTPECIVEEMKEFSMVPTEEVQDKLDRILTPYNKKLVYKKHMDFGLT